MIERMVEDFAGVDDGTVVAVIEESARVEAVAGARWLAAIAELAARRVEPDGDERLYWVCDPWDSAGAEIAAALNVGHRAASGLMHQALALRDRLPQVAALHRDGQISSRVVSALTWRTQLVEDAEALALIDAGLAKVATRWGRCLHAQPAMIRPARSGGDDPRARRVQSADSATRPADVR